MKYTIQRRRYDCGPIAIFNALRYFNKNEKYKRLGRVRRICKTNTFHEPINHELLLKAFDYFFDYRILYLENEENKVKYKECILKHLESKPILLQFDSVQGHGHLIFIEKYVRSRNRMYCYNMFPHERLSLAIPKEFKKTHFVVFINDIKNK